MMQPAIQWYPGHIAKAERQLKAQLAKVDLVIEVRDARIPRATSHPRLKRWMEGKHRLLVINRRDMVSEAARLSWDRWLRDQGEVPWWCDAKTGTGVKQLQEAAIRAGDQLNARRAGRGMRPRPVRALVLGFPNVGKSALINRLVRQKAVESARRAGVTRTLRWVRVGQALDLLDAPGVLPPRLEDQRAALLLALCDDIGQAAYDGEGVAVAFLHLLDALASVPETGLPEQLLEKRYGVALPRRQGRRHADGEHDDASEEDRERDCAGARALESLPDGLAWLEAAAARHTSGDTARMAQRLLDDFRRAVLGPIALERPPQKTAAPATATPVAAAADPAAASGAAVQA
ncbi:ribosome biogenesis GTPase YlqF [Synechococcus sp. ATX 2A4]|uniref:ribosome biogenesis GTPase YlqF n=1 Tax=Synechococcus sp. ATX 2A4 TaxID=2823727 RepID=UPI0020CC37F1|nr:ribosome biogenesis GTPase YlqF [Synechococcus sp. ATX 2A4]MCP9884727.1 ribosome biogenesis GTPase YlqF [Synechococcus sp. ATX 2A4]